jgi:glutamine amidotransferase-like uncharacterized protein
LEAGSNRIWSKGDGMKKFLLFLLVLSVISLQILLPQQAQSKEEEVILFLPDKVERVNVGNPEDISSYEAIARELGLSTKLVNHQFINERELFFSKEVRRKFKVIILPGGEPGRWFEQVAGYGINCQGVNNILSFIESGGSVIAVCICAPSLFSTHLDWENPNLKEAQKGEWNKTNRSQGYFKRFCGVDAFKGTLRGPQESNKPYPKTLFLPIKMNPENEIVKEANLPPVIHQIVVGGGSILPDKGQSLDVVGWFPNNTAAIGIVPYGKGRIIMSNPHPNITGVVAKEWRSRIMSAHARRWGWTEEMVRIGEKLIKETPDPDGPDPDWALAKAILAYVHKKASE